ncbi:tape measure domain-containing protein [Idiomarina loihiensis]|uniref:tape measure protein n=1 Tax=Idiomarina TaxID=135575 RepID=UPI000D71B3C6|nr:MULTISPECIES: tape measure protein [Idiomarina]PWW41629.1 tape measure domain-containing protein [Idiomarina loihiensis]TDP50687.1 tape measure domain-containing protein [Idiomarina loihiensis]TDS25035.1 tape measure domain-containing protein [Idiomarina sp. H2]
MSNDLSLMIRLKGESSDLVNALSKASAQNRVLNGELRASGASSQTASRGFDQVTRQSSAMGGALRTAGIAITTYFGVTQLQNMATNLTSAAGKMQDAEVRLRNLTGSSEEFAEAQSFISETAERQSRDILVLTDSYARLLALQSGGIVTGAETREIMIGINDAAAGLGATSAEVQQVMYGLSQALASPVVRAEELNQVVESLPSLLQAMDKASGAGEGGFRQMVNSGQVTSEFFKTTLIQALKKWEGAAESTYDNINSKIQRNRNSYYAMANAFEDPIDDALTPLLNAQSAAMEFAANNAQTLATALQGTLIAGVGSLTGMLGAYIVARARATQEETRSLVAKQRSLQAEYQQAVAAQRTAQFELNKAAAFRTSTAVLTAATAATNRYTAAQTALTAANARVTAAQTANAAATAALAGRMGMLGRIGGGVLRILGGWPGLLITGGLALMTFGGRAKEAAEDTFEYSDSLYTLSDAITKTVDQLKADQQAAGTELQKLSAHLDELVAKKKSLEQNNKMTAFNVFAGDPGQTYANEKAEIESLELLIEEVQKKIKQLKETQGERSTVIDNKSESNNQAEQEKEKMRLKSVQEQAQKMLESLEKQKQLQGQVSEAAKVRYEVEHGALKEIEATTKQLLIEKAKELDAEKERQELQSTAKDYLANLREQANVHNITTELARVRYQIEHGELQGINAELEKRLLNEARLADAARQKEEQKQADKKTEQQFTSLTGSMENDLMSPEQRLQAEYEKRLELIDQYGQLEIAKTQEVERAKLAAKQLFDKQTEELQRKQLQTQLYAGQQIFDGMAGLAKAFGGEQSAAYKAMFAVSKGFAIAQGVLNLSTAISNAFALPWPTNIPAMATAATEGGRLLTTIKGTTYQGQAHDGISRVPASNEGTWMLRRDEMVLNPRQRDNFEHLVNRVDGMSGGRGGAQVIEFSPQIAIDARGAAEGVENRLEGVMDEMMEQMKQELYDDFANNGPLSQRLRSNAA